ncbi:MAG: peptidoglycan DD-metalloendopeptidase family protein [Proteobacteria bacterium]|nr:peptidoglycan DD-metalloendopeptidase family protein [Pseudomonadota bacterium]
MKTRLVDFINRIFPERQIHLRTHGRVSFTRFTQPVQIFMVVVLLLAGGWMTFSSITYLLNDAMLASKEIQITDSKQAYRTLLGQVSEYQKKFSKLSTNLEDSHDLMLGLVEKNASLRQSLTTVAKKLDLTQTQRTQIANAKENLKEKLSSIEIQVRDMSKQNFSLTDNLSTAEADLQKALAERNQSIYEGSRMHRRIKRLETRLADIDKSEELAIQRLTDSTTSYIKSMEKIVSIAGLDMKHLLKDYEPLADGQGGPFIAAEIDKNLPGKQLKDQLSNLDIYLGRWESLQSVMQKIPLSAPLDSFNITSSYGKRRDPINKRWAAHYGLDLGGPFNSSVYAPAPGVVSFAGWKGKYGKLIEIDHGAGLKTRYGHLNKILVKKGQAINFRDRIGLLGSTGRSTGAHLHYEVAFRGQPKNPMMFIKAGRNVFQE